MAKGILAGLVAFFLASAWATASAVLYDHFDNNSLDPAWQQQFSAHATGWAFVESGTHLTVTDVGSDIVNSGDNGHWVTVALRRPVPHLADFSLQVSFGWDSDGRPEAMQYLLVTLLDVSGKLVAECGYVDPWFGLRGTRLANLPGGLRYQPGYNTLPFSGTANVTMNRSGNTVTISWDGTPVLTGVSAQPVVDVVLVFAYYPYVGPPFGATSLFGSESVDLIEVVPEPASVGFIAAGLVGMLARRRRKR